MYTAPLLSAMSCPGAACRFLGGPSPSLPAPQLEDGAAELFHRELLARGAVCCLPPPAKPFISLLPPLLCSSPPEGWGWASFRDADGLGFFFSSANSVKRLSFERAGVGKELFRLQQKKKKKVFPKSNIYAMRAPWWELHILPWGRACREGSQRPGCLQS